MLREAPVKEAIGHALWEAHACIGQWAFCACLAMLRKAIDLWSSDYRDRHGMKFDKLKGERDNIYWRLKKIAEENKLYKESIHSIIDGLRLDANDAVHDSSVCSGGQEGVYTGLDLLAIRDPYRKLHTLVINLITTTIPGIRIVHSDYSQWQEKPPNKKIFPNKADEPDGK